MVARGQDEHAVVVGARAVELGENLVHHPAQGGPAATQLGPLLAEGVDLVEEQQAWPVAAGGVEDRAKVAFAAAAAAIACAAISTTSGPTGLLGLTFALGLWAMATGLTHTVSPRMRKVVLIGAAAATALAAMGVAAVVAGAPGAGVAVALVLFSGIAATWVTALA